MLVHTRDGDLRRLLAWSYDSLAQELVGETSFVQLPPRPGHVADWTNPVRIPADSIVLLEHRYETTSLLSVPATAASVAAPLAVWHTLARSSLIGITLITGLAVALTPYCIADPKACFGSCPTFYIPGVDEDRPVAEGFSSSVSPVLEAVDVDAIRGPPSGETRFRIQMKNEALETHVVRHVNLLAAPRRSGTRIFRTGRGEYWEASQILDPIHAAGPEGSCLPALGAMDGIERWSAADSLDLAARETLDLEFPPAEPGAFGIVIGSRQTLLTTYLFYQTLAYMGSETGTYLAMLERVSGSAWSLAGGIGAALGGLEVFIQSEDGTWQPAGVDHETGPIASDIRLVCLPETGPAPTRIRIRLTRGAWRVDWVALARLESEVQPLRFEPQEVRNRKGVLDESARANLITDDSALITLPGDEYELSFELPEEPRRYEWFLESRGYYLEWIRKAWLDEEDPGRAVMMLTRPSEALRVLAPEYKSVEARMEQAFWASRFSTWPKAVVSENSNALRRRKLRDVSETSRPSRPGTP